MSTINNSKGWKQIKNKLKSENGQTYLTTIRILEKHLVKTVHHLNKITFYKRCKKADVIPKGMRIKLSTQESRREILRTSCKILEQKRLKAELNASYAFLESAKKEINKAKCILHNEIPSLLPEILDLIDNHCQREHTKVKARHLRKFQKLVEHHDKKDQKEIDRILKTTPKCIENRSSIDLSPAEKATLSLGLNFAIPLKNAKHSALEMIINVEKVINETNDENVTAHMKQQAKNEVVHTIKNYLHKKDDHPKTPQWISNSIKTLKAKPITITKADKGNLTVVMDNTEYNQKMQKLIDDSPYVELNQNPILPYQKRIKQACLDLFQSREITKPIYDALRPDNVKCPILYGLPKLHKDGIPMRPIVDYRYTPGHSISNFLKYILKCTIEVHPHTLKNTYTFVEKIENTKIDQMDTMVSFDVTSLFTNVPVDYTIDIIMQRLQSTSKWKQRAEKLTLLDINNLLHLVSENYITWRGKFYKQTKGSPMGSPLSPLLAEVFLQEMERKTISTLHHVKIWLRSVDDVFAICRKRKENEVLQTLNGFHEDLKFTTELENDGSLNFLDVKLTRSLDGTLQRKVYRKPTHSNRYLEWNSHHHRSQKIAVIDSLVVRALRICDTTTVDSELKFIEICLSKNGYPKGIVRTRIQHLLTRKPPPPPLSPSDKPKWCAIPYIGNITYQIAGIIRTYLKRELGYYTGTKLSRILNNYKDKSPSIPAGVYSIPCDCGKVYIGESKNIAKREKEHESDVRLRRITQSTLAQHLDENTSHNINTGSIATLCFEKRWFPRIFKESIFIHKYTNNINRNPGYDITSWLPLALDLV